MWRSFDLEIIFTNNHEIDNYDLWNKIDRLGNVDPSNLELVEENNEDEIVLFDSNKYFYYKLSSTNAEKKSYFLNSNDEKYKFYRNGTWISDKKEMIHILNYRKNIKQFVRI